MLCDNTKITTTTTTIGVIIITISAVFVNLGKNLTTARFLIIPLSAILISSRQPLLAHSLTNCIQTVFGVGASFALIFTVVISTWLLAWSYGSISFYYGIFDCQLLVQLFKLTFIELVLFVILRYGVFLSSTISSSMGLDQAIWGHRRRSYRTVGLLRHATTLALALVGGSDRLSRLAI